MSERWMKKSAPFSALPEQNAYIKQAKENRLKEIEKEISDDQILEIEYILNNYSNEYVKINYFNKKTLYVYGFITKIDPLNGIIKVNDVSIKINSIKNIEIKKSYDFEP